MTLMLLRHPNIVLMITACFSDKWRGQECIVWYVFNMHRQLCRLFALLSIAYPPYHKHSELMEGGNLYDILHVRKIPLSGAQKRSIMIGVGRGARSLDISLVYLSLSKFLHRNNLDFCSSLLLLSEGLSYLHGLRPQLIHRDLTPANILLDASFTVPKLSDFGICSLSLSLSVSSPLLSLCLSCP